MSDVVYDCTVCLDMGGTPSPVPCPYCGAVAFPDLQKTPEDCSQILMDIGEREWKIDTIKRMKYLLELEAEVLDSMRVINRYNEHLSGRASLIAMMQAHLSIKLQELQKS